VAADQDLSDLAGRQVTVLGVDHAHLDVLEWRPDRERLVDLARLVERRDRRRLAQAVALEHRAAEDALARLEHGQRERGAARDAEAQPAALEPLVRALEHRGVHGRHAQRDRHAVRDEQLERLVRVEAGKQRRGGAAAQRRVEPAGLAERVEQRQRAEQDVVLVQTEHAGRDLRVAVEVEVRELRALRRAGRPGRVEEHGEVVRRDVREPVVGLHRPGGERTDRHALARRARRLRGSLRMLVHPVEREDHPRAGVAQQVLHLAALVEHVQRHDHRADAQRAVVGRGELRDVREHDRHAVAAIDPVRPQEARGARARRFELRERDREVAQPQRHPIAVALRTADGDAGKVRAHGREFYRAPAQWSTPRRIPSATAAARSVTPSLS
jgi:hypothetical protein